MKENKSIKRKKRRKRKKNENIINNIDDNINFDIIIDIDDSLPIIFEADCALDNFKDDILEETEFNNGNKIIPQLSSEFLKQFQQK